MRGRDRLRRDGAHVRLRRPSTRSLTWLYLRYLRKGAREKSEGRARRGDAAMMTAEENDLLCRVEGDAPMGQIMRRHWIAACLSEEVAQPDGAPIKVKLLGEDLVVFRDSKGRV